MKGRVLINLLKCHLSCWNEAGLNDWNVHRAIYYIQAEKEALGLARVFTELQERAFPCYISKEKVWERNVNCIYIIPPYYPCSKYESYPINAFSPQLPYNQKHSFGILAISHN